MKQIKKFVSDHGQRLFIFLIEEVRMFWYIVFFAMTVIIFGIVYTKLTPMGEGIGQNLQPHSDITYATGIYFSIVTISSLGYGDMHPMGLSKVL
ncbi:MAG: ion channel, partial [Gemmatimonadetes bacterium]|nr:ion channel [Gemmatimonadota bacterium]